MKILIIFMPAQIISGNIVPGIHPLFAPMSIISIDCLGKNTWYLKNDKCPFVKLPTQAKPGFYFTRQQERQE